MYLADYKKKKVPPKEHFNISGRLYAGFYSAWNYYLLIEKFFNRAVLKKPGEKLRNSFVYSHLARGFVDVERTDRIQFAPVLRTESRVILILDPLRASRSSAFFQLPTHLIQNIPHFRQRVGAAPIA